MEQDGLARGAGHGIVPLMRRPPRPADPPGLKPPPDEPTLREAALRHLARYATTETGLLRVLHRRIDRWARERELAGSGDGVSDTIAAAREAAARVVTALAAAGAVNDADFAASRARNLLRAGRSRRAVEAHLASRGVQAELAREMVPEDPEKELAAALAVARRRRIGPFRIGAADEAGRRRELGMLARAGFPQSVAVRALGMEAEEAEEIVLALRR